jgi:inner membrane protein
VNAEDEKTRGNGARLSNIDPGLFFYAVLTSLHRSIPFCSTTINLWIVDALTHALAIIIILAAAGTAHQLIPFAIVGTVILDADIFFSAISDRVPELYILTHGGAAHSIAGAGVMSVLATAGILLASLAGMVPGTLVFPFLPFAFILVLAGALVHIAADALAFPGIPLLFPLSEKKITLGILPGPSLFLFGATCFILVGAVPGSIPWIFALKADAAVIIAFMLFRTILYIAVRTHLQKGVPVPLPNPVRWLVIEETDTAYTVCRLTLPGRITGTDTFQKYTNTSAAEVKEFRQCPELRRLKFNSYAVTAEKDKSGFVFSDPLREKGYVYYPPRYTRAVFPAGGTGRQEP